MQAKNRGRHTVEEKGNSGKASSSQAVRSAARMRVDYLLNDDRDEGKIGNAVSGVARLPRTPKSVIWDDLGEGRTTSNGVNSMGMRQMSMPILPAAASAANSSPHSRKMKTTGRFGENIGTTQPYTYSTDQRTRVDHSRNYAASSATIPTSAAAAAMAGSPGDTINVGENDNNSDNNNTGSNRRMKKAKRFKCESCGSAFSMRSNLRRHVKTVHEDRRGWRCDICGAAFGLKQNLCTHVRVKHEKLRPFTCDACGGTFGYKQVLQNHRRSIHGKDDSNKADSSEPPS